jgi:hypothetical protein
MYLERIKFYADTPHNEKNKFFCFKLTSIISLEDAIYRFIALGFLFRAVYYEKIHEDTGEIENQKIPTETIQELYNNFDKFTSKQKEFYINVQIKSSN